MIVANWNSPSKDVGEELVRLRARIAELEKNQLKPGEVMKSREIKGFHPEHDSINAILGMVNTMIDALKHAQSNTNIIILAEELLTSVKNLKKRHDEIHKLYRDMG